MTNLLSVYSSMLLSLAMFFESFAGVLALPQAQKDHHS